MIEKTINPIVVRIELPDEVAAKIESTRGPKGDKGDTGATGPKGDKGDPGYTPVKGVDYFDGADGQPGADGKDGYTPVKGTDYFTDADKTEMVAQVIAALPVYNGEVADT